MQKKRKLADVQPLIDGGELHPHFVAAANSISCLYSQSVHQQRRAAAKGARSTLERTLHWLLTQCPGEAAVSKTALYHFLQAEYESVDGSEHLPHTFPVQLYPQAAGHHHVQPASEGVPAAGEHAKRTATAERLSPISAARRHFSQQQQPQQAAAGSSSAELGAGTAAMESHPPGTHPHHQQAFFAHHQQQPQQQQGQQGFTSSPYVGAYGSAG